MIKTAALEETDIVDPKTGKGIRVSTTARIIYRKAYPQEYGSLRNARLNLIIAKDFVSNSGNVLHYFRLGSKQQRGGVGEIRGTSSSFFVSAVKDDSVDILTIQTSWLKPKYKGTREDPIALGDF